MCATWQIAGSPITDRIPVLGLTTPISTGCGVNLCNARGGAEVTPAASVSLSVEEAHSAELRVICHRA